MRKFLHSSQIYLAILIITNLILGWLVFQDYGQSWDEPFFYEYAASIPGAYNLHKWLNGSVDVEAYFGQSNLNLKMYGPAYLLLAHFPDEFFRKVLKVGSIETWHLLNFLIFQVGGIFLYRLCRRWVKPPAALTATLLFMTQPLLWGHAFINPKDIPFMAFFILALETGLRMVDNLCFPEVDLVPEQPTPPEEDKRNYRQRLVVWQKYAIGVFIGGILLLVGLFAFGNSFQNLTRSLIQQLYAADPASLGGRIFNLAARNASGIPVEEYVQKGLSFLGKWQRELTLLSSLSVIFSGLAFVCLKLAQIGLDKDILTLSRLHSLPALSMPKSDWLRTFQVILVPGILLGLTAAIRILGLFGWFLVGIYFFLKTERRYLAGLVGSGVIAFITMVLFWPYLWPAPLTRWIAVLQYMSSNPISVPVLFNGTVYSSLSLPRLYFPTLLGLNLTEPVWPLFLLSLFCAVFLTRRRQLDWRALVPILLWFFLPLMYILLLRPPMYDGIRHFLFILPPVFILCSLAIEALFHWLRQPWLRAGLVVLILAPGIFNLIQLHPYQYTYFNTLAGGLKGAFRKYDLDYWLTCYKEAVEQVEQSPVSNARIFVLRVPEIAAYYASDPSRVVEYVSDADQMTAGDLLLLSTRENLDKVIHPEYPTVIEIGRQNATFCVVKEAP